MKREFIKERLKLFNLLYKYGFHIKNKEQLIKVFSSIKNRVATFESNNSTTGKMGEIYPDNKTSYSVQDFTYLFFGGIDQYYDQIFDDLNELYLANLSTERTIDQALHSSAVKNL